MKLNGHEILKHSQILVWSLRPRRNPRKVIHIGMTVPSESLSQEK
jgi:hypothetical protein